MRNITIGIVPWSSRNEWLEVYENTFGNDIEGWKAAFDIMATWSVRVEKLPMGVEATLPLLQARYIASCAAEVDSSFAPIMKAQIISNGICKFVNIIAKSIQADYYEKKSLHELAKLANIPLYLVNLRNEIIHSNSLDSTPHRLHKALQEAWDWIKTEYWDKEAVKMQEEMDNYHTARDNREIKTEEVFLLLSSRCNDLVQHLKANKSVKRGSSRYTEIKKEIHGCLKSSHLTHANKVFITIAKCLLIPLTDLEDDVHLKRKNISEEVRHKADMVLEPILKYIESVNGTTDLLCAIVNNSEDGRHLLEWMNRLELTTVDWKKLVKHLLDEEKQWTTNVAIGIMKRTNLFSEEQVTRVSVVAGCMGLTGDFHTIHHSQMDNDSEINQIYSLQSLTRTHCEQTGEDESLPLGIIHSTQNYPQFYRELILNIP